eukprot:TRINITY_DN8186_c0_g3_i9.p1 TRINITY_DN8186_c0_g3~~TRINITY_DN8186_c0_g3_i9.p1  ORF type:complete len:160 (+),score=20.87 TRINITY_DN8186_c0_g3_i9:534-1013(+)
MEKVEETKKEGLLDGLSKGDLVLECKEGKTKPTFEIFDLKPCKIKDVNVRKDEIRKDKEAPLQLCNGPVRNVTDIFPKCVRPKEGPLLTLLDHSYINDCMEIPNEFNDPLRVPYVSSMSPQNKRKASTDFTPVNKFSKRGSPVHNLISCLLYTSDAADE